MRRLYSLALILATPLILVYFGIRGFRDARYWSRWSERLGWKSPPAGSFDVLIHAASLGEVNAASPLISTLLARPDKPYLLVTTTTPTGSKRVEELFAGRVRHVYLPLDYSGAMKRFLRRTQPQSIVIIETEIWPNLYYQADRLEIPLIIANARLSRKSLRGYQRVKPLIGEALGKVDLLLAQSRRDAARFAKSGVPADRIQVSGNLKFDINVPVSVQETGDLLRTAWGPTRNVLVAGSTHEADETELFSAFSTLLKSHRAALLVIAPRHPERFTAAVQAAQAAGLSVCRLSQKRVPTPSDQCFVVDTMGELLNYYAAADIAFVGGTIAPIGGHNVLEPAALGKPIFLGPHTAHVQEITSRLLESGAALKVASSADIAKWAGRLFRHPAARDRMGQAGLKLMTEGSGALDKTLTALGSVKKHA